ncbi:hypothetical protein TNIN_491991 [Trichonephila inaurata madagascariensis]|uniref:Uncharacterized protein n=1 Tax=Trichonephila inaurata madagascariensis TaxID=2747483 RepID=A0A8X6YXP9_9ARAC|nr:hypothetical protein TNIN_491991 [Trichonephila inaurata madagascariensis]
MLLIHSAIVCHPFTPAQPKWDKNTVSRPVLIFKVLRLLNSSFGMGERCVRDHLAGWSKERFRTWRKRIARTIGQQLNRLDCHPEEKQTRGLNLKKNYFFVCMMEGGGMLGGLGGERSEQGVSEYGGRKLGYTVL